jgi:uncharacterized membrane protein
MQGGRASRDFAGSGRIALGQSNSDRKDAMKWACPGVIVVLLAGGCASVDPPGGAGEMASTEPVPRPVQDAHTPLSGSFEVFTSEPEWRVRVDADSAMVLEGRSVRRELRIEMSQPLFDGRYVMARDATGTVDVRITPRLCQDASGAMLDYTARVTIEGTDPVIGCGRPID